MNEHDITFKPMYWPMGHLQNSLVIYVFQYYCWFIESEDELINANNGFNAELNCICAIEDGICYITDIRSGWNALMSHRFEYMCGNND